jgi:hypothetical protein
VDQGEKKTIRRFRKRLIAAVPIFIFGGGAVVGSLLAFGRSIVLTGTSTPPSIVFSLACLLFVGLGWLVCSVALMRGAWKTALWTGLLGIGCYAVGFIVAS